MYVCVLMCCQEFPHQGKGTQVGEEGEGCDGGTVTAVAQSAPQVCRAVAFCL